MKFRHKPTEVFAVHFPRDEPSVIEVSPDFPIRIETCPTGEYNVDGLLGPIPLIELKWIGIHGFERTAAAAHNTMILARPCLNSDSFYLDFMNYDTFYDRYELVE